MTLIVVRHGFPRRFATRIAAARINGRPGEPVIRIG